MRTVADTTRRRAGRTRAARAVVLAAAVVVVLQAGCRAQEPVPEERTVTLFFENICCSCDETPEMTRIKAEVMSLDRDDEHVVARAYDIYSPAGHDAVKATAERLNREAIWISAPTLVVDNELFLGEEAIMAELDRLHGR